RRRHTRSYGDWSSDVCSSDLSYIMPLIFIVIIPAIAAMLPGVELTPKLALVPILNVSLLCKELVIGTYHWNYIAIIFASTCVYEIGRASCRERVEIGVDGRLL